MAFTIVVMIILCKRSSHRKHHFPADRQAVMMAFTFATPTM
ncbi:hypothetical protein ACFQY3_01450 [Paenibacillus farraposensis]